MELVSEGYLIKGRNSKAKYNKEKNSRALSLDMGYKTLSRTPGGDVNLLLACLLEVRKHDDPVLNRSSRIVMMERRTY